MTSPYLPEAQWADANDQPGVYQAQCASYVASALFASLAGRPDISIAVRRLTTRVTRWTVPDDAALVRLMAYLKAEASLELVGTFSHDDVTGLQLELSTDADWNGDACTTRSVSGMHLELLNPNCGNVFPLAWRSSGQSATSCSTAESEVVAFSHGLRHVGLPVQDLVQEFLGKRIPLVCLVDNQQAITAVKRGYSKRLRCLNRTHRIAIGSLHEIVGTRPKSGALTATLTRAVDLAGPAPACPRAVKEQQNHACLGGMRRLAPGSGRRSKGSTTNFTPSRTVVDDLRSDRPTCGFADEVLAHLRRQLLQLTRGSVSPPPARPDPDDLEA